MKSHNYPTMRSIKSSHFVNNKQLLEEVFVICGIINGEASVIIRAKGEADNTYRDLDNSAYHKNRIQLLSY